jgi:hypothetical protein
MPSPSSNPRLSWNRGRAPFCRLSHHLHLPLQQGRQRPAERWTCETRTVGIC